MTEEEDEPIRIDLEAVRNQRFMIETARDFLQEVDPWKTRRDKVKDDICITLEEFNKWRRHLLKILGVKLDE